MSKKNLNMIALIILLLGQTILGPMGVSRAFAEEDSAGLTSTEVGSETNQDEKNFQLVAPPVTTTSPAQEE